MSLVDLETLRARRAFQPLRTFEELPLDHVRFDEICGDARQETALHRAVVERRRVTVIGRRGSGKSSLIATVLDPFGAIPPPFMPIRVPVAMSGEGVITDPGELARLVIGIVANGIGELDDRTRDAARNRASESVTTASRPRRLTTSVTIPVAKLQLDVKEVVTEYKRRVSPAELMALAVDLFRTIRSYGVDPVLVLDDTDSWFADRSHLAVPFFDHTLRMVVTDLDCPLVAAVHDSYREIDGFEAARRALFPTAVEIPRLDASQAVSAVGLIVARAIEVHGLSGNTSHIFSREAMTVLADSYGEGLEMRDIERILDHAVGLGCDLRVPSIDDRLMRQAAVEEGH